MTAFPSYSTGTVSIGAGATTIVGSGTSWTGVNARPGDDITVAGHIVQIVDVTDSTHLVIDAWPYTAVTAGATYKITQNSPLRFVGGQAMADVSTLVGALNTSGFFFFVPVGASAPDASYGNDGQYAYQPSTGLYWLKTGGVWVLANAPVSGYGGTSTTSLLIAVASKVFTTQPGLAYNGARVRATSQANHANWMEGLATYSGTTLTLAVDLIGGSGTFADWQLAVAGNPGDVSGAALKANNLSDLASASTARTNLGLGTAAVRADTDFPRTDTAQSLTSGQKLQARANIEAAPFQALAFNNIVVNGGMEVDQANAGSALSYLTGTNSAYQADGWVISKVGTMVLTGQQVADAPAGFTNSLKITVGTAEASLGASDYVQINQRIEGFRTSRLQMGTAGAQSFTVGFWTKIHRTGSYSGQIGNSGLTRSYPFTFTQNVADTWEYKTVVIPGDIAGTWIGNTNGIGIYLGFTMAAGTSLCGTANTWAASNFAGVTGTTNGVAATTDIFQITGVSLTAGSDVPTAANSPNLKRSYTDELRLCQRYYWQSVGAYPSIVGASFTATAIYSVDVSFPNTMRTTPTITVVGTWTVSNCGQPTAGSISREGLTLQVSGSSAANLSAFCDGSTTYLKADARL